MSVIIRPARPQDASHLIVLIDIAGYGMPSWVWSGMRKGEASLLEVGRKRAMREEGGFSYRNAWLLEDDGEVAGLLLGYPLDNPYDTGDLESLNPAFRPLVELEAEMPGSWYVNVLAVYEEHRGKGHGARLLSQADSCARISGIDTTGIIVESNNDGAVRLYKHYGYEEVARRPHYPFPGSHSHSRDWIALKKELDRT